MMNNKILSITINHAIFLKASCKMKTLQECKTIAICATLRLHKRKKQPKFRKAQAVMKI